MSPWLTVLGTSYKWNHTMCVCVCVWLPYSHNVSKGHLCYNLCQSFLPFWGWIIVHCMDAPHLVYPLIPWGTSGLLPPFGCCEQCAVNTGMQYLPEALHPVLSDINITRSEIAALCGSPVFKFLRNHHTVSKNTSWFFLCVWGNATPT